ncbi:MAG TPA: hypothetical protein V6D19_08415 [Stenomitos sp.]
MAIIESRLTERATFNSFFGPVYIEPGRNTNIPDGLWRNLKKNNPDVQSLLKNQLLFEVEEEAAS